MTECSCYACAKAEAAANPAPPEETVFGNDPRLVRMPLCPNCGHKRCPAAADHRAGCTGSNEPGQRGSLYEYDAGAAGGSFSASVRGRIDETGVLRDVTVERIDRVEPPFAVIRPVDIGSAGDSVQGSDDCSGFDAGGFDCGGGGDG